MCVDNYKIEIITEKCTRFLKHHLKDNIITSREYYELLKNNSIGIFKLLKQLA